MLRWLALFLFGTVGLQQAASGAAFTVNGLTFSDERGGFILSAVSGTGTLDDPYVIEEELTGDQEAILTIRGASTRYGNVIGTQHAFGIAIRKVVMNRSGQLWRSFDMELRQSMEAHSPYEDGLSFGQGTKVGRPFVATSFDDAVERHEPFDSLAFALGKVEPGETAIFSFILTDSTPQDQIILIQQPLREVAGPAAPIQNTTSAR